VRGEPQVEGELQVLSPDNADISHLMQPATAQAELSIARAIVWWISGSKTEWFTQRNSSAIRYHFQAQWSIYVPPV
jgi:hypothetical protein